MPLTSADFTLLLLLLRLLLLFEALGGWASAQHVLCSATTRRLNAASASRAGSSR
jgi:hypothetical protein